jgi:hypothetical protein
MGDNSPCSRHCGVVTASRIGRCSSLHDPILTLAALTGLLRLWASGRPKTPYSHHAVCYVRSAV